jgi:PBP1b-binding outer membrane lipoprotein LpoB
MKTIILIALFIAVTTSGCKQQTPLLPENSQDSNPEVTKQNQNASQSIPIKLITYLTYLTSTEDPLNYCNGTISDSDGYRKTITHKVTTSTVVDKMTPSELAKATVLAATSGKCNRIMQQTNIKVAENTAYIATIEGSAGISITMCSCRPEIEVNLLQLPGINKVVFE